MSDLKMKAYNFHQLNKSEQWFRSFPNNISHNRYRSIPIGLIKTGYKKHFQENSLTFLFTDFSFVQFKFVHQVRKLSFFFWGGGGGGV